MNVKVGPFFDSKEEDMLTIDNLQRPRKPTVELLESVKLRPTYFSFPTSNSDISPTLPNFRFPRYGYYGIQHEHDLPSPGGIVPSPKSYLGDSPHRKTTIFGTVVNSINFFVGIGVLALPFSLRKSGWFGVVVLPLICLMMSRTAIMLGRCQYRFTLDTYPDIVEVAFGRLGRSVVTCLFYLQLLFEVTIFQVLLVQCLNILDHTLTQYTITWLSTLILILLANIFTSKVSASWLTLISCVSITLLCVLLIVAFTLRYITMYEDSNYITYRLANYSSFIEENRRSKTTSTILVGSFADVCRFLAITSYCFMGHSVLPSIYRNMKRPSQFPTVVYYSFFIMVVVYTLIGAMGYAAYGSHVNSNVMVNIYHIHEKHGRLSNYQSVVAMMVIAFILITLATKYALASVPITESLYDWSVAVFHSYYAKVETYKKKAQGTPESMMSETYQVSPYADEVARSYQNMLMETQKRVIKSKIFGSLEDSLDNEEQFPTPQLRMEKRDSEVDTTKLPTPFSILIDEEPKVEEQLTPYRKQITTPIGGGGGVSSSGVTKGVQYKQPEVTEIPSGIASFDTLNIRTPSEDEMSELNDVEEPISQTSLILDGIFRIVVRTLLPFLSMWFAKLFPHFIVLLIFAGGVLGSLISTIIPAACYLKMFRADLSILEKITVSMIISVAVLIFVSTLILMLQEHF